MHLPDFKYLGEKQKIFSENHHGNKVPDTKTDFFLTQILWGLLVSMSLCMLLRQQQAAFQVSVLLFQERMAKSYYTEELSAFIPAGEQVRTRELGEYFTEAAG